MKNINLLKFNDFENNKEKTKQKQIFINDLFESHDDIPQGVLIRVKDLIDYLKKFDSKTPVELQNGLWEYEEVIDEDTYKTRRLSTDEIIDESYLFTYDKNKNILIINNQ